MNSERPNPATPDAATLSTNEARESSTPDAKAAAGDAPLMITKTDLLDLVRAYDPNVDEALIAKAYDYAMKAHAPQKRANGDPYISHPIAVAKITTELKLDSASVATALLHDVVEDTDVTSQDIREEFGAEVARLVEGVTKISKREMAADADGQAENFVKFVMATGKDLRVLLVKLSDRLHNMRTLHFIPKVEKRERIAKETMEIFAPLAGRIGVHQIKEELEDLSFEHVNPSAYKAIAGGLKRLQSSVVSDVVALSQTLRAAMTEQGIEAEIYSREKRAFSVWRKMQRKGSTFEELADIYAFRVIVEDAAACYRVLGIIHGAFPMIPDEFDDYISTPKPNDYQSIHTAVLASDAEKVGQRVEIQIRSKRMHEVAERGVAAHWRYKEASERQKEGNTVELIPSDKYNAYDWLRGVLGMLDEGDGAKAFLDQARIDLYQDQVFPFTPRGRVIPLPRGATTLDFAYALHTKIGNEYAGAKINGVLRPVRTALRNGDVVEINRSENASIPTGWENVVVTGSAKNGIRRRIRTLREIEQSKLGERIVTSVFAARDLPFSSKAVEEKASEIGYDDLNALFAAVGRMDISGQSVLQACFPNMDAGQDEDIQGTVELGQTVPRGLVSLDGVTPGASVRLALCCGPLPGERIVGVRDIAGGIIAHRIDCHQLDDKHDEEWLRLAWDNSEGRQYVVPIVVTVNNRTGALGHIGSMLARYEADIVDLHLANREIDFSDLCFDIAVRDARHVNNILTGLRASDYVIEAKRRDDKDTVE